VSKEEIICSYTLWPAEKNVRGLSPTRGPPTDKQCYITASATSPDFLSEENVTLIRHVNEQLQFKF
jgi:hypothetical protein